MNLAQQRDQRAATRHGTRMFVKINHRFETAAGMVVDISDNGVGVEMHNTSSFNAGDFVELHSDKIGCINGVVRWVRPRMLGVEFDRTTNNAAKVAAFFKFFHK